MNNTQSNLENLINQPYKYGFTIPLETENFNKGLTEETVRLISCKKNEPNFMLQFRLKAFKKWEKMSEPEWAFIIIKNQITKILDITQHQKKRKS